MIEKYLFALLYISVTPWELELLSVQINSDRVQFLTKSQIWKPENQTFLQWFEAIVSLSDLTFHYQLTSLTL